MFIAPLAFHLTLCHITLLLSNISLATKLRKNSTSFILQHCGRLINCYNSYQPAVNSVRLKLLPPPPPPQFNVLTLANNLSQRFSVLSGLSFVSLVSAPASADTARKKLTRTR